MRIQSEEDNNLSITLLSFDRPTELTERFYFLEMSVLQATTLLPQSRNIVYAQIFAHTGDNKYLDKQTTKSFKTIGDFNNFFSNNPDYYIHDCDIELENGISIRSHDDGEVSVQFFNDSSDRIIIDKIFGKYNLDQKLIAMLKNKPGNYIAIDKENNVTAVFENFNDYIENDRT